MNILVLAGGLSTERNVSLSSGSLITAALRRRGHRVLMLDVFEGIDTLPADPISLFSTEQEEVRCVSTEVPDLEALRASRGNPRSSIGPHILPLCELADVVYIALHGAMGENGQLQATLDNLGIRYTGSDYAGSLLAMDKDLAKKMMAFAGVRTPEWITCSTGEADARRILADIGLPCVIKPVTGGSSVGVSLVHSESELRAALQNAARYESTVMAERLIVGRELTCGVLEGRALPPVEIIPKQGFYDYVNKYQAGATEELCPAPLSKAETEELHAITLRAFAALRLRSYARLDFMLDKDGVFWCLEANTLPGMTPTSLLPQEAAAVGIPYDELCERLAMSALSNQ